MYPELICLGWQIRRSVETSQILVLLLIRAGLFSRALDELHTQVISRFDAFPLSVSSIFFLRSLYGLSVSLFYAFHEGNA